MNRFVAGFLDGELTDSFANSSMTAEDMERHFPVGEVYFYAAEPQGMQWRVLQRSEPSNMYNMRYFAVLHPIKDEDVPEIVRMAALMAT